MTQSTSHIFPFSAIVGQDLLKRALLLNAVCPTLGGVLIAGERGTAKTTAVRGLAALLPVLRVARGCPYRCDPGAPWAECAHCDVAGHETLSLPAPFVELPLGATEDRVAGSLDIEKTLRDGRPAFRPGLLAAAHRGVLYIDEVNLLPDHLSDLLLDAAASGFHVVEREGIAVRHPARFILVGTMNPEEGELRPQLADRFGVKVNVGSLASPAERGEVVRRRLAFDADPAAFCDRWATEQRQLAEQIAAARNLFPTVALTDEQVGEIAAVCLRQNVEGLRADLALSRAARALAALAGRADVSPDDLQAAAELVLPHRQRQTQANQPRPNPLPNLFQEDQGGDCSDQHDDTPDNGRPANDERLDPPGQPGFVPKIETSTDRVTVPQRGRRHAAPGQDRGRQVGAVRDAQACDIALDATLRAAALRGAGNCRLEPRPEDLHRKLRKERCGSLVVFVVDASGSMGARRRMEAVKGAVLGLLGDAERQRDEVAVISVRGPRAEILLAPTRDIVVAQQALTRLPTGGRTPLAHGLMLAAGLARAGRPMLLIVISDGKANVAMPGTEGDPWAQVLAACDSLTRSDCKAIVIDAEEGVVQTGRAAELASALSADRLLLGALSATVIENALAVQQSAVAGGGP